MKAVSIEDVREARQLIGLYIRKTPLLPFDTLTTVTGKNVILKCEIFQRAGSFKIRGAANFILHNLAAAKKSGVVAASAGNHAQGVAAICKQLGVRATIVMPTITPHLKVQNTKQFGAEVRLVGQVYDESHKEAERLALERGLLFVHPFKDPYIMAGQGTIALELCEDESFSGFEAIVIAVGGGGLLSGMASALRALKPKLKIYGVSAKNAPAMWNAYQSGELTQKPVAFTLAEGVAVKKPDPEMKNLLKSLIDDYFCLSEESIAHAISLLAEHGKLVVEGAGALPVAALLENKIPEKRVACLLSGGNIDLTTLSHILQRGLAEQNRLVRLVIRVTDRPGGLHAITSVLAEQGANILQIFHQRTSLQAPVGEADVEVEVETKGADHTQEIVALLTQRGFKVRHGIGV